MLEKSVTTLHLKKLLFDCKDNRPDILFRFRLIGQMWHSNFTRIANINDKGVMLYDAHLDQYIHIQDISDVIQFEIDTRFHEFQPHFHYVVELGRQETLSTGAAGS